MVAKADVLKVLSLERSPYFTLNNHYLDTARSKWLDKYTNLRRNPSQIRPTHPLSKASARPNPSDEFFESKYHVTNRVLGDLAPLGYKGLTAEKLERLNDPDEYQQELNLMADVRAYFQVAYKVCR